MIKIGVIGCGHWGPNFIRNFRGIKEAEVIYACDLDRHKLSRIKKLYPEIKPAQNYRRILEDKNIDAVVVATPADTHFKLARDALLYNKHVLVEKPIALRIDEAGKLIEIAKSRKKILMAGHTFIYNKAVQRIKKYLKKRKLGKIYYMHSRRTNLGPLRKDVSAMWDLAPHDISIFSYFLDANPVEVAAHGKGYLQKGKEDVAFITLFYPRDIIAHIHVSWLDPRKAREITIVGSEKMLIFNDLDTLEPVKIYDKRVMAKKFRQDYDTFEEFRMIVKEGRTEIPRIKPEEPLKAECRHFLESIRKGRPPLTGAVQGLHVLEALKAIQCSLEEARPIKLEG